MGKAAESWCSSIDSSNHPSAALSSASSLSFPNSTAHLIISTDLRLAPSHDYYEFSSTSTSTPIREERRLHWPPIKPLLRSTLAATADFNRRPCRQASLFVKVYMEGIPIGRKLDLFLHHGYHALVTTLAHMFTTTIIWPDADGVDSQKYHVLTYEDKEGDWMMVGDVPWEMFLSTVKRLMIKRADRC